MWLILFGLLCCFIPATYTTTICPPNLLAKFVDPLPTPKVIDPVAYENYPIYSINITQTPQKLHRDLPPTQMWVYDGTFPGPTFEVDSFQKIHVVFTNNLPMDTPLLPQSDLGMTIPQDRIVVHLHGGISKPQYCGHPLDSVRPIPGRNSYTNYYGNQQPATMLWYHDHTMQITAANVYAGLVGAYIIRDSFESSLGLPSGEFEIPLILCDKNLNETTGQLIYEFNRTHIGGTYNLVNGKVWPIYKKVKPAKYRFRILNASNHRVYNLFFDNRMIFNLIGGDQGFVKTAVPLREILISPSERVDIIVDFSQYRSRSIVLKTDAPLIYPIGPNVSDCSNAVMMQFRVSGGDVIHSGVVPSGMLLNYELPVAVSDIRHRYYILEATISPEGRIQYLINREHFLSRLAAAVPVRNTEIWEMRAAHPIHVHAVGFLVLDRRPFNRTHFAATDELQYTGPAVPVPPREQGYKDSFLMGPYETARVLITFAPYTGEFVMHCHILEHEDYDMMRRFAITPVGPDCEWDEFQTDSNCTYWA